MKAILSTILVITTFCTKAQELYMKTFGKTGSKPLIYLHGGPGYNAANFESTTAQRLADNGFFVIVYDRRGEGRSKDPHAAYTFNETFSDLNAIYEQYKLKSATLIAHSFGGVVAVRFAAAHPAKVPAIVLVSAPVSMQESIRNIITTLKVKFASSSDSANLKAISMLEKMDPTSLDYCSAALLFALRNGLYRPKEPTGEAKTIQEKFRADTALVKYASQSSYPATIGFWKNEKYTIIDLTPEIKNVKAAIYGLYGKEDGLYSEEQIRKLQQLIGADHLKYLDNCSHNVFSDQQTPFIDAIKTWIK